MASDQVADNEMVRWSQRIESLGAWLSIPGVVLLTLLQIRKPDMIGAILLGAVALTWVATALTWRMAAKISSRTSESILEDYRAAIAYSQAASLVATAALGSLHSYDSTRADLLAEQLEEASRKAMYDTFWAEQESR